MPAHYSEQPVTLTQPPYGEHKAAHYLYQLATVVAILLFLVSFWSC
ncbi:hypothetical protein [Acidicapsa ligni]|nr:hypothetical protein [Acidicapsa ligni]